VVKFSELSRGQFAGVVVAAVVFVVGAVTVVRGVAAFSGHVAKQAVQKKAQDSKVTSIDYANFAYLKPGSDADWTLDDSGMAFDQGKGIVKYVVTLKNGNVGVTISQQVMPAQLRPRKSVKFQEFITEEKPAQSQDLGSGTVYYLPALENGAPASGSDTIIYATDDILLFGRAGRVLNYETWVKLLSSMNKTAPKK
jgi:hypothetical protein